VRILFVDDQPQVLELLADLCETLQQDYLTARATDQALRLCDESVGVVVTALSLPDLNGVHFRRALRGRFPELPVFCFSEDPAGYTWDELTAHFDRVFFKPQDYSRMIAEALKRLAQRQYPFLA